MDGNILVTGGCGFVGSNIAISLKKDFPGSGVIAFDNLRRRGSELNIERLKEHGVRFVHGDVRNREDLADLTGISLIVDAAADPSVLAGIGSTPDYVINSNLLGTINCLNLAVKNNSRIIFLSTSRVYPIGLLNKIRYAEEDNRFNIASGQSLSGVSEKGISEEFGIAGARSLYGASKLASELFLQEYAEFYGLKAIINRCGVIAGPWQFGKVDQGVVVLWLMRHYFKRELNYIGFGGSGRQVRDILHVNDLYRLIRMQIKNFEKFSGEIFNVGGGIGVSASLKELTFICEKITGNTIRINSIPETRTADIPVYITDNSKVTAATGWMPEIPVEKIVEDIYLWIGSNENSLKKILD
jgi:CDP-paratose 2-epimerase